MDPEGRRVDDSMIAHGELSAGRTRGSHGFGRARSRSTLAHPMKNGGLPGHAPRYAIRLEALGMRPSEKMMFIEAAHALKIPESPAPLAISEL